MGRCGLLGVRRFASKEVFSADGGLGLALVLAAVV